MVSLGSGPRRAHRRWRAAVVGECAALAAELVLGTAAGVYDRLPPDHPGSAGRDPAMGFAGTAWHSFWWVVGHGGAVLRLHLALSVVVLVAALVVADQARQAGGAARLALAWLGVAAVVGAGVAGAGAVAGGPAVGTAVMLMVGGFVVAAVCAVGALVALGGRSR